MTTPITLAEELGCRGCHHCHFVFAVRTPTAIAHCPRCHEPSYHRKPNSAQRTLALTITAILFYVPANLLPVFQTTTLGIEEAHTIVGGVVDLANTGSWELALIVFIASVVVPVFKISALLVLVGVSQRQHRMPIEQHARLYRIVEAIGHWSMLDVFVIALLVALVQFGSIATIEPAGGAIAFGMVVVLTMLASSSFDPRLLWDDTRESTPPLTRPVR